MTEPALPGRVTARRLLGLWAVHALVVLLAALALYHALTDSYPDGLSYDPTRSLPMDRFLIAAAQACGSLLVGVWLRRLGCPWPVAALGAVGAMLGGDSLYVRLNLLLRHGYTLDAVFRTQGAGILWSKLSAFQAATAAVAVPLFARGRTWAIAHLLLVAAGSGVALAAGVAVPGGCVLPWLVAVASTSLALRVFGWQEPGSEEAPVTHPRSVGQE